MTQDFLKEFLYAPETNLPLLLAVLGVSFVLGAIHAVGPGHGKSLMAAYLIGSRGRIRDALILALTLTVSHVASVIVLAFIALWVTNFFLPEQINKWIGLFSGIMVFLIGAWLFITRLRTYKNPKPHSHPHDHAPDHPHSHHVPGRHDFSLWNNILLGISGGIIPCPKAIVILLLAISLQKISLGIVIIVVFSLGLSAVLVTLGIIMVKAAHLLQNRLQDNKIRLLPVLGSIIIVCLGVFIGIRALLVM